MQGLIVKAISGEYTVLKNNEYTVCKPIGLFRHRNIVPKVGDIVEIENNTIIKIEKRKNELVRPFVSNVDKIFIVTSLIEPELNLNLLDRLICQVEWSNIESILVFSKTDLIDLNKFEKIINYYKKIGYKVYLMPNDKESIKQEIKNNICVLAGQSGVGKSTMLNSFDDLFNIKTESISKALGRGKHTTRHIELLKIDDGFIADTPGFGTLDLDIPLDDLKYTFKEFLNTKCRFNSCLHKNEPGCNVKERISNNEILLSRYENYLQFLEEIKNKNKY